MENEEYSFDWNSVLDGDIQDDGRLKDNELAVSTDDIEAEKRKEFIQLNDENDVVKLLISAGFESQWNRLHGLSTSSSVPMTTANDASDKMVPIVSNDDVFVISLLGDTGDGKSFFINHLLPSAEKNRPVVVEETKRNGSTTANITCFESTSFLPDLSQSTFLLLDYEGERGSHLPYLLKHMNGQWTEERAENRRRAVSEYFPKLAYTLSNVIILLSRDDFAKYDYITRCYDFAGRATKNLQHNPYKPVLIMVQNYSSRSIVGPIAEVTKQFFKAHSRAETERLRNFFSAVYCMRLPYKENETSSSNQTTDTNQMFFEQVTGMKNLLASICKRHKKERTLPYISWLEVTRLVVDIVSKDRTVMMHMLLRQVLVKDPGDIEQNTVVFLFTLLYSKRDIHSTRWFYFCCEFAMSVMARAIAIRFLRSMKYIPGSNLKNMVIRDEARVCLEKLWVYLDEFRPCTALYMGQGYSKEKDHPVFCLQHKGVHHEHRTSERVHGVPLFNAYSMKIRRSWGVHDVWDGEFRSDSSTQNMPTTEMHENFYKKIVSYIETMNTSSHVLYTTLNRLLEQYDVNITSECVVYHGPCCFCCQTMEVNTESQRHHVDVFNLSEYRNSAICSTCQEERSMLLRVDPVGKLSLPVSSKDECVICMNAPQIIMFDPCHHQRFCKACAEQIYEKFKQCPLCRATIAQLIIPK